MSEVLDTLRARIRTIEGHTPAPRAQVASGQVALDARVGGLPCPGLVEVAGVLGSGGTRLVLGWAAACTQRGERVAWVEVEPALHPPTAASLGVSLPLLLVVRPDGERAAWAVEELLRSGCFGLVITTVEVGGALVGRRWEAAARQGRSTLVLLTACAAPQVPAELRVQVARGAGRIHRRRGAPAGGALPLPAWRPELDPWGGSA